MYAYDAYDDEAIKENGNTYRDNRFCPEKFLPPSWEGGGGGRAYLKI